MTLRIAALAAFVLAAVPAQAQLATCTNGFATPSTPVPGAPTSQPFPCNGVDLMAWVPTGSGGQLRATEGNDIWGWTDPTTGQEYAIVGMVNGTVFVDVTDPSAPKVLGKLASRTGQSSAWRDVKIYQGYAFIVSDSNPGHGMQVFDLASLRGLTPDATRNLSAVTNYDGPTSNRVSSAHNIAINEDSGFAYIVGASSCNGGLHMVNIQNPAAPTFAGCFSADGYTHDVQCVIYDGPDTQHTGREICFASNEDTVTIVDVTNKTAPVMLDRATYPNPAYTHQGWLTDDWRHFIVDDEVDSSAGGTKTFVMDVTDLDNVSYAFTNIGAVPTRDHNLYVSGNHAYLSNYQGGLRILDVSNLDGGSMPEVAFFDTYPQGNSSGYNGQWSNYPFFASGTIIANDIDNGLFVLRFNGRMVSTEPTVPAGASFALSAPAPNPTSGAATLALTVAAPESVRAVVMDATGREVAVVFDGTASGTVDLRVATNGLAAGLYIVRVTGETFSAARHLSVAR